MSYIFDGEYGPIPNDDGTISLELYGAKYISHHMDAIEIPKENKAYLTEVFTNPKYKVISTRLMFFDCTNIHYIDTSNWNMSHVIDAALMFINCINLRLLDLSKWDIRNIKETSGMFANCYTVHSIDISGWNTENVKYMSNMFNSCRNLYNIEGTINLKNCKGYINMLEDTPKLKSINIKLPDSISEKEFKELAFKQNKAIINFIK